ncbi:MAG: thiamine-phosphate kinase [SAR202 cluster bacterium]|nr:thiamine-phosphate kinase [SAR202 cluster bacterium]
MLVRDTGEFALIDRLAKVIAARQAKTPASGHRLEVGIGDDAAVWSGPAGATIATTDTMVDGVHFLEGEVEWRDLGWKSMASNLSDIAAMGGAPLYALITLGLRGDLPVDGIAAMYEGMLDALDAHGGAIVGGDIVSSPVFFITVSLTGAAQLSPAGAPLLLRRDAARPGDLIAVTGPLGCSGGGLRVVLEGLSLDPATSAHLRAAHYRPTPRVREGAALARHGVLAGMDISDGLFDDLGKLCRTSGVGARVQASSIPIDDTLRSAFPDHCLSLALSGGEDYELLVAAPARIIESVIRAGKVPLHVIGEIVSREQGVKVLGPDGQDISPRRGGWDHFDKR